MFLDCRIGRLRPISTVNTESSVFNNQCSQSEIGEFKMEQKLIRLLHLSDFHVGKDEHGQQVLLEELLGHLEKRINSNQGPDLVLITGDIAQSGQAGQYRIFKEQFLAPLLKWIPPGRLFMVPGNHDVDRKKAMAAHGYNVLDKCRNFFDPTAVGQSQRETLHPRFQAYVDEIGEVAPADWIVSESGTHTTALSIAGTRLGILQLNTAWLSGADGEQLKLRLGKDMVRHGLNQLKDADLIIALGHHPITWLNESDARKLSTLFAKREIVFLGGHLHQGEGRFVEAAGESFLSLHCGAGFQARESNYWVNGFQWYEYLPEAGEWYVEPFFWQSDHDEWRLDHYPFPNKRKVPGEARWLFQVKRITRLNGEEAIAEQPRPFRVLVLATEKDLGNARDETVDYLRQVLSIDAVAGRVDQFPDPADFNLVVFIQAWQWSGGVLADIWQRTDVEKRVWLVDENADWPSPKLMELKAAANIEAFRAENKHAPTFSNPSELPRLVGEAADDARRHQRPPDVPDAGLSEGERAYLGLRLPTWKAGRTGTGKGFTGIDEIYEERAYVPLDGYANRWRLDDSGGLAAMDTQPGEGSAFVMARSGKVGLRRPLAWWISRSKLPWLVVSGSPGGGKTVFLTRIAAALGEFLLGAGSSLEPNLEPKGLRAGPNMPVPVTLEGNALAARDLQGFADLVTSVHEELCCAGSSEAPDKRHVEKNLRAGRYLLLIDALDEVAHTAGRKKLLRWLKGLRGQLERARIVLTTRSARYTGEMPFGPEFEILDMTDLNKDQIAALCERFRVMKGESKRFLAKLSLALDEMAKRAGAEETNLVGNPLLLATACTVFHKLGCLPNDRAELCYQIVEHLCRSKVSQSTEKNWALYPEDKRDLLERLALAMQEDKAQEWPMTRVHDVVASGLAEHARERDRVAQYVKWLVEHTGLLYIQAGAEGESLRFHHRLFREYLAACRLTKDNVSIEKVLGRLWRKRQLTDPAWLDVVQLMPGALNNADKAKAMGTYLAGLADKYPVRRGELLATLVATIVESKNLFRLYDIPAAVAKAVDDYENEGMHWDTATRMLLLESIGWLGDPRPDAWDIKYWKQFQTGPFTMGDRKAHGAEPRHTEEIVENFWLARFTVTNREYAAFMEGGGYSERRHWTSEGWEWLQAKCAEIDNQPSFWNNPSLNKPNQPVVGISWYEAQAYCNWLSDRIAAKPPLWWRAPSQPEVVLPTEAEWEYAASGTTGRPYPWTGQAEPDPERANYRESKLECTAPVGCYPRGTTPEGLWDMAGNVWEWCRDVWAEDAREKRKQENRNPENTTGDPTGRVRRGGSWFNDADDLRAAFRNGYLVWNRLNVIGFRCGLRKNHDGIFG